MSFTKILRQFYLKKVGIPYLVNYFVTKAHTGVFPPVDTVYKIFNQMGVKITGSDRYAKIKKHKSHRNAGFIHQGVAVSSMQIVALFWY